MSENRETGVDEDDYIYDDVARKVFKSCVNDEEGMKDETLFKSQLRDIYDLHRYRELEVAIFYFQIVAMILYVIYCMVFKALKKMRQGKLDKSDPFQRILMNKNDDLLENQSFFSYIFNIFATNLLFVIFSTTRIYKLIYYQKLNELDTDSILDYEDLGIAVYDLESIGA